MKLVDLVKNYIETTLKRESFKHVLYIYLSRGINIVLRFVASWVVMNTLGPSNLGLLTLASVFMGISGSLIELGLTTTMIRKLSHHIAQGDDEGAIGIFRRIYGIRLWVSALFVAGFYFLAPFVAERFYHHANLVTPLRLAAFGAFLFNVWYHTEGVLRAYEKFKELALLNVFSQAVRVGLILGFAYFAMLNVESALIINIFETVIGFAIASFIIPRKYFTKRVVARYPIREVLHYSGWMFLFSLLFMLFDRLDVLMLGYFKQTTEVGLYAFAFNLVRPFELVPETLNVVFLPKVSKFTSRAQVNSYFRETLKLTWLVAIAGIALIVLSKPIVLLFREEYLPAVPLFQILVGAFIFLAVLNPINLVGHSLNKPQVFAMMAGINLLLSFVGYLIFIPPYGAVGAAVVSLVARILGGAIGFLILQHYLGKWERSLPANGVASAEDVAADAAADAAAHELGESGQAGPRP